MAKKHLLALFGLSNSRHFLENSAINRGTKNEHLSENYEHLMHDIQEMGKMEDFVHFGPKFCPFFGQKRPQMNFVRVSETHF